MNKMIKMFKRCSIHIRLKNKFLNPQMGERDKIIKYTTGLGTGTRRITAPQVQEIWNKTQK